MPNPILWGGDISVQSRVEREEKRGKHVFSEKSGREIQKSFELQVSFSR